MTEQPSNPNRRFTILELVAYVSAFAVLLGAWSLEFIAESELDFWLLVGTALVLALTGMLSHHRQQRL